CGCSAAGSVEDACHQTTGQCSCRDGVFGVKCDMCPKGWTLGPSGCSQDNAAPWSCSGVTCRYGAVCVDGGRTPTCQCPTDCNLLLTARQFLQVCGSDAVTYANRCQLRLIACRLGKDVSVEHDGPCAVNTTTTRTYQNKHKIQNKNKHTNKHAAPSVQDQAVLAAAHHAPRETTNGGSPSGVMGIPLPLPPFAGLTDEEQSGDGSDNEGSGDFHGMQAEEQIAPELKFSCENTKHGCCLDGRTPAVYANKIGCPPTRVFAAVLVLDTPLVAKMPAFTQETSEQFAELRASVETAVRLERCGGGGQRRAMTTTMMTGGGVEGALALPLPSPNSPETRFSPRDIERALVKQLISSKKRPINVKRPEEKNIKIVDYAWQASRRPNYTAREIRSAVPRHRSDDKTKAKKRRRCGERATEGSPPGRTVQLTVKPSPSRRRELLNTSSHRDSSKSVTAKAAQVPCDQNPCLHGGSCVRMKKDFFCCCPLGRWGKVCEKEISYFDPSFIGMSYL
uniref:Agrin n=1 Tax=Petromyzon marinus TaxID=7757 RepID=S4RAJ7_PETMA